MEIGAVSETVNVTIERPLLEATSAQQNVTIGAVQRAELPLPSRDFSNVVNLATGAIAGSTETLGAAASSFGSKASFNGLAPTSFKFTVDGSDASMDAASPSVSTYQNYNTIKGLTLEAIQEIQIAKNIPGAWRVKPGALTTWRRDDVTAR